MNPVEHLWDMVERSIHTHNPALTNARELWVAIQMVWLNISLEVFHPLVEFMPRRLAERGSYTILGTYPMTLGTSVYKNKPK
jgi:hypothetical protein